jgi:hypothetical protein
MLEDAFGNYAVVYLTLGVGAFIGAYLLVIWRNRDD